MYKVLNINNIFYDKDNESTTMVLYKYIII